MPRVRAVLIAALALAATTGSRAQDAPPRDVDAALLAQARQGAPEARGRVLSVGRGERYERLSAAIRDARDGDTIRVRAGTYVNDFAHVRSRISIIGVGGMARLVATVAPPNGKAILTVSADLQLQNLEFTGAKVPDRNGGGIRYEGGNLVILNCYFHENETHLLAAPVPTGTITIRDSEFANHVPPDDQAHSIYAGRIATLEVRDSLFYGGRNGSNIIKSRAQRTIIVGSRIYDDDAAVSYSIDIPNGGNATVTNNVIVQGPNSPNRAIISFATESAPYPGSALTVQGNTILNFGGRGTGVLNRSAIPITFSDNRLHALTTNVMGPSNQSGNTILPQPVALDRARPWRAP